MNMSDCIYNRGIFCDTPIESKCAKCGWNPEVYKERKRKADEEMAEKKDTAKPKKKKSKTDSERRVHFSTEY